MEESSKEISYRIMKIAQYDTAVSYRMACDCTSPHHDMTIELETDEDFLSLHLYADLETDVYWGQTNFFQRCWRRIKIALRVLLTGHMKVGEEFLFQTDQHIDSFINALQEGKQLLKKKRQEGDPPR
jgi:hypothetical protein